MLILGTGIVVNAGKICYCLVTKHSALTSCPDLVPLSVASKGGALVTILDHAINLLLGFHQWRFLFSGIKILHPIRNR